MRALIRAEIIPTTGTWPDRTDRAQYDEAVIALFKAMGYDPRHLQDAEDLPNQKELDQSEDVQYLFADTPESIAKEERKYLIMLGYTSEGQAKFIVCSVNQNDIHIRIRDDLFDKLRRACAEVCQRAGYTAKTQKKHGAYLQIDKPIEVIEPRHGHPTILGQIVRHPLKIILQQKSAETAVAVFTLIVSILLFFFVPLLSDPLAKSLPGTFGASYIRGALERADTAFLVTFIVTAIHLFMGWAQLRRTRPIVWNAAIEPTKPTK